MQVLKYLNDGNTLDDLTRDFGIKVVSDESNTIHLLNYDQIKSPKTLPIVMECRSLVIRQDGDGFDVVSRSFDRFFNLKI